MATSDYYKTLNVERDATAKSIKDAYRRLAIKYHPDKNKGDKDSEQRFKEINEAFSVLSDTEKRQQYDAYGHQGANGGSGGGFGGGGAQWSGDFSDLGDVFDSVFGRNAGGGFGGGFGGGERRKQRANDQQYKVSIEFAEAYSGSSHKAKIHVHDTCNDCKGNGAKGGTALKDCLRCGGEGVMISNNGFMQMQQTCTSCRGQGKIIEEKCDNCNGGGTKMRQKVVEVKIPAGINDGDKMVLRGEATEGDLIPGDVYVWVNVKPHFLYEREGSDLYCSMPVDVFDASLGSKIEIPTMSGKRVAINIPAGSQNGKVLRLKGEGMPRLGKSGHGDILVEVKVETPVHLSKKQIALIEELQASFIKDKVDHSPNTQSWKDKIKSLFK
ncbi:MAG: molecular chaperone DnaJ [Gammaproteobacteria bacterium]|nr:molecular chaperone DnaJ [Gammaproteobacteria bacterium]